MVCYQLFDILRIQNSQVITQTRGDNHFLYPFQRASFTVELSGVFVVSFQIDADRRIDTGRTSASGLNLFIFAVEAIHIGRRAAEI